MKKRNPAADYAMIVAGTFLIGFAIKNIYDPVSMVTGGVSGVAIIAKELWSVPLWLICSRILFLRLAVYQAHPVRHGHALCFPVCSAGGVLSGK